MVPQWDWHCPGVAENPRLLSESHARKAHETSNPLLEFSPENVRKYAKRRCTYFFLSFFLNEESLIHWPLNFDARRQKG